MDHSFSSLILRYHLQFRKGIRVLAALLLLMAAAAAVSRAGPPRYCTLYHLSSLDLGIHTLAVPRWGTDPSESWLEPKFSRARTLNTPWSEKLVNSMPQMSHFKTKMHKIRFLLGFRLRPARAAYSAFRDS